MVRAASIVFYLLFLSSLCEGQEVSISIFSGQGIATNKNLAWFGNGSGIQLNYTKVLSSKNLMNIGLETRTINWGNQMSINAGFQRKYLANSQRWSFRAGGEIMNGLALYRPRSIYSVGFNFFHIIHYQTKKKSFFQLYTGLGYNAAPAYRDFGPINQTYEMKIGLTYGLNFSLP